MTPVVDVAWLVAHLDDPDLVLLDASITRSVAADGATQFAPGHDAYAAVHLPGARFADLYDGFSDPEAAYLFTRPTAAQLDAALRAVGVGPRSTIVVYDQLTGSYAARVWLVLRSYGVTARVLDGGLAAWTAAGHPTESGPATPVAPGEGVVLHDDPTVFADLEETRALSEASAVGETTLVCALREVEYRGDPERERTGHIPGSLSLPFPDTLDAAGRYDAAATRERADALGVGAGPVLAYCGGGVNAAGLALAFVHAGLDLPRVYDGSLNEWRAHPELPLVVGTEPA
ncbi:rhodanese-like domain-containing protein [Nocardioides sp.]|uniref:sulfurtransferase n=1 Tax=Nocardioides sp. TaxID=35761 RepID=UPI00261AFD5D|nr:rhodanese-like domain-containing protein [Nocardioides sp.]